MAKKKKSTGNTFLSDNMPSYKQVKKQRKQAKQQTQKVQPKQAQRVVRGGGSQYNINNDKAIRQNQQKNNPQAQQQTQKVQTSYLKNSLDRQGQPRARISETSRSGVVNHGKDKQESRFSQNYLKNTTQQKSLGNRFLDDKSKIGDDPNNRIDRLTKAAVKQSVGSLLSGVSHDSNIYNETKKDLDNQLRNGKINKKTYDANMKAAMQSDTRMRRLKNWESSDQHKAYQELAKKGEELQTSGDKDKAIGMKGLNRPQRWAAEAYTSGLQMAGDLMFGPAWFASMGTRVMGSSLHSTKQLVDKGVISEREADRNAFLQATKEVGTEYIGRGVGLAAELKGAGAPTRSLETMKNIGIDRLVSRIKNTTARNIAGSAMKLGSGAAEEAGEELLGGILDAPITNASYANRLDKDYRSKLQENSNNIAAQRDSLIKQGYTRKQATKLYQNEISSQEFLDNLTDDYIQNGLSKKAARKQASNMQAYLSASLNGDSKKMKAAEDKMAAGIKQKFSASDTIDAMMSAGLSAAVTGVAGEVRTNTTGANIKAIYQAQNGVDGAAKAITSLAKGLDDKKMAARASAMYDYIDSGKGVDLSNEQYYTLQGALQAQFNKNAQDAAAATRAGRNSAAKSRYITAATADIDNAGRIRFGTTVNAMDEQGMAVPQFVPGGVTEARADTMRSDLNRLATQQEKQTKEHLSDKDEVIEHIIAIENGYVMPESTEFFTDAFPENRALYEQFTGETLPADNTQMRQYLFNRSAQNYEASARLETIDRIDRDKGQLDSEIANTYGQEGQQTFQKLSNNIGLEDTGKYVAYSSALGQAYDAGLSGASLDSAMKLVRDTYGIGEQDVTDMYQAGVADKENGSIGATVRYDVADRTSIRNSDRDTLLAFARAFGRNIVVTDNLTVDKAKDIQSNKALREDYNGPQVDGMFYDNTIYINLAEGNNRPISYTIMHELTHSLKDQFAADYAEFADLFKERYVEKYGEDTFNKAIQDRIDLYKDSGVNLDKEGALEEIICDQMGEVLTDENFVQNVAENHPDLAHSLLYAIKAMLQKIRNLFAQYEGFPPRYNEALLSQLDLLKDAEKLLMQAMEQANENRAMESETEGRYLFGGPKAYNPKGSIGTTMEEDPNFKRAQEMKNSSASDEEIWAETGWQYNNGNWRFEIDDTDFDVYLGGNANLAEDPEYKEYRKLLDKKEKAFLFGGEGLSKSEEKEFQDLNEKWGRTEQKLAKILKTGKAVRLDMLVHDNKLFTHYPLLKSVRVYMKDLNGKATAMFYPAGQTIYLDNSLMYDKAKFRSNLLHEIQHYIQRYEGRTGGTNPIAAGNREAYISSPGEREARETESRADMSAEQRRESMPNFSITKGEYDSWGWMRANDVITPQENADWQGKLKYKNKFHKTSDGMYIIPTGTEHGIDNVLIITDGDYNTPKVSAVIRINDNEESILSDLREVINGFAKESSLVSSKLIQVLEQEGILKLYRDIDYQSFEEYRTRRKGSGSKTYRRSYTFSDGEGTGGLSDETGSDPDNGGYSNDSRPQRILDNNPDFAVRRLTEDSSGFKVVPATENEFKDSVIRNEAGQLERMYINAETFAGGDSRFTSYSVTGDLGSSLDGMYGYAAHNVLGDGDDAVYLNVHNPATENKLTINKDQLTRLIKETVERTTIPNKDGEKDFSESWVYGYADKNDALETAAEKAADAIISADGMADAYVLEELYDNANVGSESEAKAFYNDVNYYTGIDGIISNADDGSQVVLAFKPEQIKQTANAGEPGEMPRVESVLQYASDYGYDTDPVTGEGYPEVAKSRVAKNRDEVMAYIKNSERNATKLTHDTVLNEKTVKGNIKELVNGVMDNTDNTPGEKREALDKAMDAARELWGIYASTKYFTKAKPDDLKLFRDVAIQTAHDIVKGARYIDDEAYDNYKQVTNYLKSTRIMFTAHDAADVDMGDPGSFRRKYFGRIRLSKDGVSLEDVWADIGPMIAFAEGNDYVKDDVDHQIILEEIASFLDNSEAYYDMEADAARLDIERQLAEDIVETVTTNGDPWNSFADKKKAQYDERIAQLKARQKEAMREAKDKWKEQEKKSRKKRYEKRRQQKKERHKNYKERMKSWGHIQKNYDYLSKRLLDPKKDEGQNIPENLRVPLAKVLKEFDLQTKRSAKIEKKKGTSKATAALRDLRNEIAKIASEDGTTEFVCHPSLFGTMDRLVASLDGKSLRELNNEDLADIDDMLAQIKHMIAEQNTLFSEGKRQAVESAGRQVMDDMKAKEKKYGRGYTYSGAKGLIRHIFNEDMMTPGDFFELMGGELGTMGDHLRESFDDYIEKFKQTADFTTTTFNRFMNVKKPGSVMEDWKTDKSAQTFKLDSGEEVTMTVAQMMSLYCMSKREAAMNHIMGSGIVLSEVTPARKIDELVGGKQENRVEAVRMSYFDVQRITEALTKEQRQVADELQGMMTGTLADWGNETSMQLYGIKLFKDDFYFPIKVSNSYLTGKLEDPAGINGSRILSFSFTKPLVEQASNPLIVGDIFDIFTDHANKMALYSSFAASLLDFNRVYNYKHRSKETGLLDGSVKQAIEDAYGKRSITYINNFLDDINGQAAQRDDGITQAISVSLNHYKRAAIGINLRVLVQQPTAIMRSLYYLSPKYFTPDCFTHLLKKKQEMHDHCPIAYWKANGNYQTDFTRTLQDQMFNRWSKYDAATMGFYGLADDLTWTVIWGAVKNEVEAKYPKVKVGSEEYWTLCNRRATEVFDRTQVVDSVFHRSDAMRSTNGLTKMASSFMAEPTRTYNMLRSSIVKAHRMSLDGDRKGAINEMTKVITVLILNAATVSATSAVIDALRGKGDDDDDKSFYEKWLLNFWENFAQNANPLLQVVWVKDIATLFIDEWQGNDWGTSNMALEGWYKLAKGFAQVQKVFSGDMGFIEWISGDFGAGLGYVLGVPYYNFIRDAKSIWSALQLPTFASDGTETSTTDDVEKPSLLDYERNPIKIQDGSWGDNVLNHFGINLTKEERRQKAYDQELSDIEKKTEGLSGSEKRDKVNSLVMEGYTKYVEGGDTAALKRMRQIIKDAGGSTKDFDEKVGKRVASEYKKTINTKDVGKQEALQDYLLHHGWSQEDISSQIVYYSDTARKFKAAAQLDDEDAMVKALVPLMNAGLTDADVYRLYENRNRGGSRSKGSGDSTGSLAVPTYGTITSGYGYRTPPTAGASSYHEGIDIGAAMGSKVDAADGGTVVYTGYNGGYGNQIVVQHSNGMKTYYSHLANIGVSPGQRVSKGQYIGNVGSTGTSTGPHLDFRVQVNGTFVNPMKYING